MSITKRVVEIEKFATAIRIPCEGDGSISTFPSISIFPFLKAKLTEYETAYDYRARRTLTKVKYQYFKYNRGERSLLLPVNALPIVLEYLDSHGGKYEVTDVLPNESDDISITDTSGFEDRDYQKEAIRFLISNIPMKALELQTGCLTGDSIVNINRGGNSRSMTLELAYHRFNSTRELGTRGWDKSILSMIRSLTGSRIRLHEVEDIVYSGIKEVYLVTLANGKQLKCTITHKIMTKLGWIKAGEIIGHQVMCDTLKAKASGKKRKVVRDKYLAVSGNHPYAHKYQDPKWNCYRVMKHRLVYDAHHMNGMTIEEFRTALHDVDKVKVMKFVDPDKYVIHHKDHNHNNDDPANLKHMTHKAHRKYHTLVGDIYKYFNQGIPTYSPAVSIEYIGKEKTYDICCKKPHHNFVANDIVVHNSGKSYIAIRAIMKLNKKALIILPANLVDQWYDVLSTTSDASLSIIKGSKSIYSLFAGEFDFGTDIYIASISTMFEYATGKKHYDGLPSFSEFIKRLDIGVKITDECHLSFYQNAIIDIQCNVEHNIYLSATHLRSCRASNDIFKRVYPDSIRYGGGKYDKYVNITECEYTLGSINEKRIITKRGYSQFKYEQLIMKDSKKTNRLMDEIMIPLIEEYYMSVRKTGQKLLILVGLTEFAEMITEWMKINYPTFDSQVFLYKTPESVLDTADIIVSTIGSCGTGKDISNLRTMILLVSFASETLCLQTIGRLRKIGKDTPEFVWMYNRSIAPHVKHGNIRRLIYADIGKTYNKIKL